MPLLNRFIKKAAKSLLLMQTRLWKKGVKPIADEMNAKMCVECDVTKDEDVKKVFEQYAKLMIHWIS